MSSPNRVKAQELGLLAVLIVSAAVALGCAAEEQAPPDKKWNLLILVPDTVRADHLGTNGYPKPTTPHLDALAADGTNFTQAITVAPRTWQSFSSILTGLYPPRHGVRYVFDQPLAKESPTLASLLSGAGYDTAAFDMIDFLERITRGEDFGHYESADGSRASQQDPLKGQGALSNQVLAFAKRPRTAPFMIFVRFAGGHWPYTHRDPQFGSCGDLDHSFNQGSYGFGVSRGKGLKLTDAEEYRKRIFSVNRDPVQLAHVIAHYDAAIHQVDGAIGRVLDGLRESGQLDDTVVIATSDHGESFGEHGYLQHGPRVDDPVMRVPLIVWLPPGHPARHPGGRVNTQVRTVDLLPTALDALGLPIPEGLDGVSLLPMIRGEAAPELPAYGESGRSFMGVDTDRYLPGVEGKHRMMRTESWKLVRVPHPEGAELRLYDLEHDPGETRDVAEQRSDVVEQLRQELDKVLVQDEGSVDERKLDEEELRMLRELGYVQ